MASGKRCPDFALILKSTEPDSSLNEQIAVCFQKELNKQAFRRCQDSALAEDAAQDALVLAFQSLGSFRGDAPIDHWLKRLVVSACSRLRRGRKNDPAFNLPLDELKASSSSTGDTSDQEAKVYLGERLHLLQDALEEIAEENRELFLLHEGQEMPLVELAERFGMTIDGVKSRLRRTRAKLRQRLISLAEADVS